MARSAILGNGRLAIGLNQKGLVHDFYYPYVGLDNLTTARSVHHKIGVWINGVFSWVDDGNWQINCSLDEDAMISNVIMRNDGLQIELVFSDFVDFESNAFCRYVLVNNLADEQREIRLFMHQVFQISRNGRADTAQYVPSDHYILNYKGRCCLLVGGQVSGTDQGFDQHAVGSYGIEGKEGTFKDAEDGELSGSNVEHGGVDSVIRFKLNIPANESANVDYWIVAAETRFDGEKLLRKLKEETVVVRLIANRQHWAEWLSTGANVLHGVDAEYLTAVKRSLLVIKAHIDARGGIIASCDSGIYNYGRDYYSYVWPRDGAYALWPLIRLGYKEEPQKFFEFCRDVLTPEGYLAHKYQPDKAIGSSWHALTQNGQPELAIQEDETASVIFMLGEYYQYSKDKEFVRNLYETLIKPASDFMAGFIDEQTGLPHPSFDLWEMKFSTNTYTAAITYQALLVAADFAEEFEFPDDSHAWRTVADRILRSSAIFFDPEQNHLRKGFLTQPDGSLQFDNVLDVSSLYGMLTFDFIGDNKYYLTETARAVETKLLDFSYSGGAARFEDDGYFRANSNHPGNPWIITTLWMAQYYIRTRQIDKARHYVAWSLQHATASGMLPEQVNPDDASLVSVTPLVWSHAELINTALDLAQVSRQ